ncbi:hypothetical protein ACFQ08_33550, partial [Streptosporangium algeriense]
RRLSDLDDHLSERAGRFVVPVRRHGWRAEADGVITLVLDGLRRPRPAGGRRGHEQESVGDLT